MAKKRINQPTPRLVLSVVLLVLISVTATAVFAYLLYRTPPLENTLVPGSVQCEVTESFDGNTKTDVAVKNTGNTAAYIRAALLITWRAEGNTEEILARSPEAGVDYEIVYGANGWAEGDDGYWYYTTPVEPEESTTVLVESITPKASAPDGYSLSVEIAASAIQSEPIDVVKSEWDVIGDNNVIIP